MKAITWIRGLLWPLLLVAGLAHAQFDGDGVRRITIDGVGDNAFAQALALRPGGSFYVAGYSSLRDNADQRTLQIRRFNADGSTDADFSVSQAHLGSVSMGPRSLLVQPDGKLIAAYTLANAASPSDSYSHIVRFGVSGSLDASFTRFEFDGSLAFDQLDVLALQADGKILAAGSTRSANGDTAIVARLNTDGTLDTGFANDGYRRVAPNLASPNFFQRVYPSLSWKSVNLLEDGRIFLAGTASSDFTTDSEWMFLRLNADGSIDTSFNGGQVLVHGVRSGNSVGAVNTLGAADVAPDGTFLAGGRTTAGGSGRSALLLFDPNGALLSSRLESLGTFDRINDVQLLPNGGAVAVGSFSDSGTDRALIAFYVNGIGVSGDSFERFGSDTSAHFYSALAYDPNGQRLIGVASGVTEELGLNAYRWVLTRNTVPGQLDVLPDAFSFAAQNDVAPNQTVDSEIASIGGFDPVVRVPLRLYNGSATLGITQFTDTPPPALGTLRFFTPVGDPPQLDVQLQHTAASGFGETVVTSLMVGGVVRSNNLALTVGTARTGQLQSTTAGDGPVAMPGNLRFASTSASITEGQTATLNVQRVGGTDGAISVAYAIAPAGGGASVASGTLNWADADSGAKTVSFATVDDEVVQGTRTFTATLSSPGGGAALGSPVTATIMVADNDAPTPPDPVADPGRVRITGFDSSVREGQSATFTIQRLGGRDGAVSVGYSVDGGSAIPGADYARRDGTLSWADGDGSARTVTVETFDNRVEDGARTFELTLGNATGGLTLATPSRATVTITDDDAVGEPEPEPTDTVDLDVGNGLVVRIATAEGAIVDARTVETPATLPGGFDYPLPFIAFDISGVPMGATVTVALTLPAGIDADAYVKCDDTGCTPFASAQIDGARVVLTLTDGGAGDRDGLANGLIRDPGTPVRTAAPEPPAEPSTGGGGAMPLLLLLWLAPALWRRHTRRVAR